MRKKADVICQHTKDGKIIPLKLRIEDEDGERQTYSIKGYRVLNLDGKVVMPNEVRVASHIWNFECKLCIWGKEKLVGLTYNALDNVWYIEG